MNRLLSEIISHADPSQVATLSRFFRTGPGEYGEGDRFLGIKVPVTRSIVKECWRETGFEQLEECIRSEYHEVRLAALLALVQIFSHARKDPALRQRCVEFYLGHLEYVNNWDLVDLSCYEILGQWLLDREQDRILLYDLARDGRTIWEQRIGIVSTMQFIRHGQVNDSYAIAEIFLDKPQPLHDLLQKAVGWLLRETGKCDEARLRRWIVANGARMPRTMLRYAIEKFPEPERQAMLKIRSDASDSRSVNPEVRAYIEERVVPQYDAFDPAHRRDHVQAVMSNALQMSRYYDVDPNMVAVAAACHDLGLREDRKTHHLVSGRMIREDSELRRWFTPEQIEVIAQAAEDHRASSDHEPRSIYGRIIAEADRLIDPLTVIRRTIQFGFAHYPELDKESHWQRMLEHLHEKYAEGGYLKLWIPESPNAARLGELRGIIRDEARLRDIFEEFYAQEVSKG